MDLSPTRRGVPSTFVEAAERHRMQKRSGDALQYGLAMAVLTGDLALVISDKMMAESGFPAALIRAAAGPVARMRLDAVAGQYLDISADAGASADAELAARIAELKTASYSIEGPLMVGATLAGATEQALDALRSYARPLGAAFQLSDDLLGLLGDTAETGKDAERDLRQGKPTSLIARALRLAPAPGQEIIRRVWGKSDASPEEIHELRVAVRRSGAVESIAGSVRMLVVEARNALRGPSGGNLKPGASKLLGELAGMVSARVDLKKLRV
jgi:geranylgeranyl diphosphate synthase, type I